MFSDFYFHFTQLIFNKVFCYIDWSKNNFTTHLLIIPPYYCKFDIKELTSLIYNCKQSLIKTAGSFYFYFSSKKELGIEVAFIENHIPYKGD